MKKHSSILSQMLQMIPRYEFQKAVKRHNAERHSKGFSSWAQFVALLFCQIAGHDGLRGVVAGLAAYTSRLYHLGVSRIRRSTLSYANCHRSHTVFQEVFLTLLAKVHSHAPGHKFRFKNPLYSFDATTVDLALGLYDWAKFRKTKGGIKIHVKLNHNGYIPEFITVTNAKRHEVKEVDSFQLRAGDVVVFDRGYTDFARFAKYCDEGIYFITRLKKNAVYRVVERRNVSKHKNISSDQVIELRGYYTKKKCPVRLRRIRVKDPETKKYIELLTNQLDWSPATIGAVYKDRWQIEIFFKTIKQNLKVKSFLGTSKNAILSQIWVAMIAYLLLSYMKFLSSYQWTINSLAKILPTLLFSCRNLWDWLNEPFGEPPPAFYNTGQLELI